MIMAQGCLLLVADAAASLARSAENRALPTAREPKQPATALHNPVRLTDPSPRRRDFRQQGTVGMVGPARERQPGTGKPSSRARTATCAPFFLRALPTTRALPRP